MLYNLTPALEYFFFVFHIQGDQYWKYSSDLTLHSGFPKLFGRPNHWNQIFFNLDACYKFISANDILFYKDSHYHGFLPTGEGSRHSDLSLTVPHQLQKIDSGFYNEAKQKAFLFKDSLIYTFTDYAGYPQCFWEETLKLPGKYVHSPFCVLKGQSVGEI